MWIAHSEHNDQKETTDHRRAAPLGCGERASGRGGVFSLRLLSRSYGADTVAPSPAAEIVNMPLAFVA